MSKGQELAHGQGIEARFETGLAPAKVRLKPFFWVVSLARHYRNLIGTFSLFK
jgi:hypothetical protein